LNRYLKMTDITAGIENGRAMDAARQAIAR
jgi:hypothetical protein